MKSKALLLDEPAAGLDEDVTKRIIQVLNDLNISFIKISHDKDFLNKTTRKIQDKLVLHVIPVKYRALSQIPLFECEKMKTFVISTYCN